MANLRSSSLTLILSLSLCVAVRAVPCTIYGAISDYSGSVSVPILTLDVPYTLAGCNKCKSACSDFITSYINQADCSGVGGKSSRSCNCDTYEFDGFGAGNTAQTCSFVTGDPHFTALDGSTFEFHGYDGSVFNLLSNPKHLVNARFSRLDQELGNMFMNEVAVRFCDKANVTVKALPGHTGITVEANGRAPSQWPKEGLVALASGLVTVQYKPAQDAGSPDRVQISTPDMTVTVSQVVGAATRHLDVKVDFVDDVDVDTVHGVLGQTHAWAAAEDGGKTIAGGDADYEVSHLLAHDFKFNTFQAGLACAKQAVSRRMLS